MLLVLGICYEWTNNINKICVILLSTTVEDSDTGQGSSGVFGLYVRTIRYCFPPPPTPLTTAQSSSTQTAEPIVKCHTILEMGSHDLSPHTFRSGL